MSTSTPPPPEAPPVQAYERGYYAPTLPLPFVSGELVVFVLAWVVVAVATLAAQTVDTIHFVQATVVLAVGYMLARGIAKAGRSSRVADREGEGREERWQ